MELSSFWILPLGISALDMQLRRAEAASSHLVQQQVQQPERTLPTASDPHSLHRQRKDLQRPRRRKLRIRRSMAGAVELSADHDDIRSSPATDGRSCPYHLVLWD